MDGTSWTIGEAKVDYLVLRVLFTTFVIVDSFIYLVSVEKHKSK